MLQLIVYVLLFPIVIYIVISLFQYLWNTTMPAIFNLKEVSFWQAFRLLLIAAMLLGVTNWQAFGLSLIAAMLLGAPNINLNI